MLLEGPKGEGVGVVREWGEGGLVGRARRGSMVMGTRMTQ